MGSWHDFGATGVVRGTGVTRGVGAILYVVQRATIPGAVLV